MITSADNEKLKLVRKLADRRWREKERAFVTEGEDLLEAGLVAGVKPIAVLAAADPAPAGADFADSHDEAGLHLSSLPSEMQPSVDAVEPGLLAAVSALGSGTRVVVIWPLPGDQRLRAGINVYLHGIGDPGNVGAIIRSADALGAGTVVCGPGSADPFGPKAVRATMGSIFNLPIRRATLETAPRPRIALVSTGGLPFAEITPLLAGGTGTLCLGAERDGLPADLVEDCDAALTIPIRPGVDSLNVAAAAAIALERIHSAAIGGGASDG